MKKVEIQNRSAILPDFPEEPKRIALDLLEEGINSALPDRVIQSHLSVRDDYLLSGQTKIGLDELDRIIVIGGGKASLGMAKTVEAALGSLISDGLVITKEDSNREKLERIRVAEGSHPFPDSAGVTATKELLDTASSATSRDLVIFLLSGGGSSLLTIPREEVKLEDLIETTGQLMARGASIDEINTVRKHLSRIKGGRLARAIHPARTLSLILSDVVGNELGTIASGPTVPEASDPPEALAVLEKYGVEDIGPVRKILSEIASHDPSPPVREKEFADLQVTNQIVASNSTALSALEAKGQQLGLNTLVLSSRLEGESREAGRLFGLLIRSIAEEGHPVARPALLLSGGETTVSTGSKTGKGGPNQEFTLAGSLKIKGIEEALIGALDSDGEDGSTEIAGGLLGGSSDVEKEVILSCLEEHCSSQALEKNEGAVITGPTGTNVNDIHVGLVL